MTVLSLDAFAAHLADRPGVLVGLDLGTKTIGVAVTDARRALVAPLVVVRRTKFTNDAAQILKLAASREAVGYVLGLPLNMDGSEGPRAQSSRSFARHFEKLTDLPIILVDERLSTFEADDILARQGLSAARRREMIDAAAAAVILQTAIDLMTAPPRVP